MRLFVAIEVPNNVKEELKKIQSNLNSLVGLRFVKDFHLTLLFMGEVPEKRVNGIIRELNNVNFSSFKLKISEIGFFPNSQQIRVIWVGFKESYELNTISDNVYNALKMPFKGFKSHLTIARVKHIQDRKKLLDLIDSIKIKELDFKVKEFKLIKSDLTKMGPIYNVLATFKAENTQ